MKTRRFLMTLAVVLFCASAAMAKDIRTAVFKVAQMKCENCVRKINNNIRFEKGLKDFNTDLKTKTVTIMYDADKTNVEKLKKVSKSSIMKRSLSRKPSRTIRSN